MSLTAALLKGDTKRDSDSGDVLGLSTSDPGFGPQIEPACRSRNEDVVNARMLLQTSAGLQAVATAQVVSDDKDIPSRIVGFNVGQRGIVALGIARGCTAQHLAIAHA